MKNKILAVLSGITILAVAVLTISYSSSPPIGLTGSPFDNASCVSCHSSYTVNSGSGSIQLSGISTYTPSQVYTLTLTISDPFAVVYGFQLVAVNSSNASVGTFGAATGIQAQFNGVSRTYLSHSAVSTTGTWTITWTAPATNVGTISFYFVGNAADDNSGTTGDYIYTSSLNVSVASTPLSTTKSSTNANCATSCTGTASVTASNGTSPYTYLWSNNSTSASISNLCPGTYTVTVTDFASASVIDTIAVGANPPLTSTVNASICAGQSYILPGSGTATTPGIYVDTLNSSTNCDSIVTTNLTVYQTYRDTVNASICQGNAYTLPSNTPVSTAGTYIDTLSTVNNCDSIIVTQLNVNPTYASSISVSICQGQFYTMPLSGNKNASGIYSDTLKTASMCDSVITVNLTVNTVYYDSLNVSICQGQQYIGPKGDTIQIAGVYRDTLSTVSNCDSVVVTNLSIVSSFNDTVNASICAGNTYILPSNTIVSVAGTYIDSLLSTANCDSIVVTHLSILSSFNDTVNASICAGSNYLLPSNTTVSAAGTYVDSLLSTENCDSIVVTHLTLISVSTQSVNASICQGGTYQLPSSTIVTAAGQYIDTLQSSTQCDSIIITQLVVLPIYIDTNTIQLCFGDSYALPGGGTATSAGFYTDSLSSINNCDSIVVTEIIYFPQINPLISILSGTSSFCDGDSVIVAASGGNTYVWNMLDSTAALAIYSSGNYVVEVFDTNSCSAQDSILITVFQLPIADAGNDISICEFDSAQLNSTFTGLNIWSTGDSTSSITIAPLQNTSYTLVVIDSNSCSAFDSVMVFVMPLPVLSLGADTGFCPGDSILLSVSASFSSYLWSNNDTSSSTIIYTAGQYSLLVTDSNMCANSSSINISTYTAATVNLGADFELCDGENKILNAGTAANYSWNTGANSQTITVDSVGTYMVTITNSEGCMGSDTVSLLSVHPIPVLSLGNDTTICDTASLVLSPGVGFNTYLWSTGDTNNSITVNTAGTYSVTVTNLENCANADSMNLAVEICYSVVERILQSITTNVYPNPTQGEFSISIDSYVSEALTVQCYDIFGKLVEIKSLRVQPGNQIIEMNVQTSGMYFIVVQGKDFVRHHTLSVF